jgi:cephalosporin hydroxylase
LKKIGLFPIRNHYFEPLFDDTNLRYPLSDDRYLPGLDLNVSSQLSFLDSLKVSSELQDMRWDLKNKDVEGFCIYNPSISFGDADFLYQFIRAVKPRKIIEIGSGYSTKVIRLARLRNHAESGIVSSHICIEPYEWSWLNSLPDITLVRKRVEECDIDWATELVAGDLLFIDSSHMIRPQGDVLKEYLEILPQLASGVYVHIHDIFTPKDYLDVWIVEYVRFWNEQYLLEALLSNTGRYEVISALNYLKHHHYDKLKQVCPYLVTNANPGSFYIRVR